MFSTLADIVIGFFEFVVDVLLFRGQRRAQGHRERSAVEDTIEVARFDFVTLFFIALVSAGLMFVLAFAFGVPAGWSMGIGLAVGTIWGVWRYHRLVREP
ncbi:hypothetical protein [Acidovorax sp. Root219]|uniref:hypothetical protein n=1 Tax=Acidovorax sp. Root219 TaxID=1736493 RepID=UPI000AF78160|nr:hypothetical protein [Acidovorax sp. Root219]